MNSPEIEAFSLAATVHVSLDEFLRLEDTEPASEYASGEVLQKPMPTRAHAAIQLYLGAMLLSFLQRTGLGAAFTEFRCIFGPPSALRTYVPDVTVVLRQNLTAERYLHRAPDLAIEILSPDQDRGRLLDKIQFYLLHGVQIVWVIDPARQTVAVLAPDVESRVLTVDDAIDGGAVLPGFTLAVSELFGDPVRTEAPPGTD